MNLRDVSGVDDLITLNDLDNKLVDYHIYDLGIVVGDIRVGYNASDVACYSSSDSITKLKLIDIGGVVVGFTEFYIISNLNLHIDKLFIYKEYRGKGIGSNAIEYITSNFKAKEFSLRVFSKNIGAMNFYKRLGYVSKVESNKITELYKEMI